MIVINTIITLFFIWGLNVDESPTNNCIHKFCFNILIYPYNTLNSINVL